MALWTAYPTAPVAYREGKLEHAVLGAVSSGVAEGAIRAGCGLVRGTAGQQVAHPAALAAADVDALVTAAVCISNVAGLRINTIAEFDGAGQGGGKARITPARPLTITYDAAADWDAVGGQRVDEFFGFDANGDPITEQLVKINGSGTLTLTTVQKFSSVDIIDMQASNAGAGTATIGVAQGAEYGSLDFMGISIYDRCAEVAATANMDFDTLEPMSFLEGTGEIGGLPEDAVAIGEPVFMRIVAGAGALIRGRFTGVLQADDANFCRVLGYYWSSAATAGNPATIKAVR